MQRAVPALTIQGLIADKMSPCLKVGSTSAVQNVPSSVMQTTLTPAQHPQEHRGVTVIAHNFIARPAEHNFVNTIGRHQGSVIALIVLYCPLYSVRHI